MHITDMCLLPFPLGILIYTQLVGCDNTTVFLVVKGFSPYVVEDQVLLELSYNRN